MDELVSSFLFDAGMAVQRGLLLLESLAGAGKHHPAGAKQDPSAP
jgi:hypothetical protein